MGGRWRYCGLIIVMWAGWLFTGAGPARAQPTPSGELPELVVLLRGGEDGVDPAEVVAAINRGQGPPGLTEGNPVAAEIAITRLHRRADRERILARPDSPEGRLFRYVVFRYEDTRGLHGIMNALARHELVEHVERHYSFRLSAASVLPSDPWVGQAGDPPESSQWAVHVLNLPQLWGRGQGPMTVGLIDTGIELAHFDLRAFSEDPVTGASVFAGGGVREHLSADLRHEDCNVDELDPQDGLPDRDQAGHGTHTAGLIGARANNGQGTAGGAWWSSLVIAKAFSQDDDIPDSDFTTPARNAANALVHLVQTGVQVINMSFGFNHVLTDIGPVDCDGNSDPRLDLSLFCQALALAEERDVIMVAASGNDLAPFVEFPASDPRVVAAGGLRYDAAAPGGYSFWQEDVCPFGNDRPFQCGSNSGPEQELALPAAQLLSSVYTGENHTSETLNTCGDVLKAGDAADGVGACSGTSMAAAMGSNMLALARSMNPVLPKAAIRDAVDSTASLGGVRTHDLGFGLPDGDAAAVRLLGTVGDTVLANRLTPLFSLYSPHAQTHLYVTSPIMAMSFVLDEESPFQSVGPAVPGYPVFLPQPCQVSPCPGFPTGASVYVFTTDAEPFPGAPPLVPLYRMRFDPDLVAPEDPNRCMKEPFIPNRDFTYTTEAAGVEHFKALGYELDGVEGFVFGTCAPGVDCQPVGTVRLMRLYNFTRDDYAIFPETEEAAMRAQGYVSQSTLSDEIGFVYLAVDSDGDHVIDGFEGLAGTRPDLADTDCDGLTDGEEMLVYDTSSPDPAQRGYGDPRRGPCIALFEDGFETGDTSRWSNTSF